MSEMDESVEIVVALVPGELLQFGLQETWQHISGSWMQHDDQLEALMRRSGALQRGP